MPENEDLQNSDQYELKHIVCSAGETPITRNWREALEI